jgi:hypothetical protein
VDPRARRSLLEGVVDPRARRSPLEGALDWATPMGRGGRHGVGRTLGACLSEECFVLVFLGFKQDSPGCFRGPSGLSPTLCTPDIIDLPILNLEEIGRPFEIKTSTIRMVQHSPFTDKEDPNFTSKHSFNYVRHSTWMG